jgi:TolB-like protein
MRRFICLVVLLGFIHRQGSYAQERDLKSHVEVISNQIAASGKKIVAVVGFNNDQGYGPRFSQYLADSVSTLLTQTGKSLDVVTRTRLNQIMDERKLRSSAEFDRTTSLQVGTLVGADVIVGGNFSVLGSDVKLNMQLLDVSRGTILGGMIGLISRTRDVDDLLGKPNGQPGIQENANNQHMLEVAQQIGLTSLEYGGFTKVEDERVRTNIKNGTSMKLLFPNGNNFAFVFLKELREFLSKPESSLQVIFAKPDSEFYREETQMTNLRDYDANRRKVEDNKERIKAASPDRDKPQFKYFNTQFRLPLIIINDKFCYITLRLSPDESPESPRLEFEGGYAKSCVAHFNKMWSLSDTSENVKP